uniref:DDE Tnp4 domain-containing protein n=1 Tax=Trichogramma kaykai TaxID=54128 RepID=A0ABD2WZ64_9HYME
MIKVVYFQKYELLICHTILLAARYSSIRRRHPPGCRAQLSHSSSVRSQSKSSTLFSVHISIFNSSLFTDIEPSRRLCKMPNLKRDGEYERLFPRIKTQPRKFRKYLRMTLAEFEYILSKLESSLSKDWCNLHISIFPEQQLVKTIRFLVTDKDFEDLATQFDIGHSTACVYVRECLKFIWEILQPLHIPIPTHADFPANSGSAFYNYKRFHSCVLQAVVDTDGKFIFIEVCPYGSQSDGGIFGASQLQKAVKQGLLPIPEKDELPSPNSCKSVMPYYFIGDRAYPLKPYLMKPIRGNNLSPSQKILISVCHEPGQEDERDVDDEDLTYFINEKCEVDENEHGSEFQEASRERQKVIQWFLENPVYIYHA